MYRKKSRTCWFAPGRLSLTVAAAVAAGALTIRCAVAAPVASSGPAACRALAAMVLANAKITSASWVAAGTPIIAGLTRQRMTNQPAHCLVRGEVGHHIGRDGQAYGDRFELRLPLAWNGRFLFQGGGGLDGILLPALGLVSEAPHARLPGALARGFAVTSTDGGHEQSSLKGPGDFGADPRALADYEYDSTRVVAVAALALTKAYYRRAPSRTYFLGCSNGGREGMIAAQRYPTLFDGVVAGSPAFDLTRAMVAEAWNTEAIAAIAPRDATGRPDLARALSDADLRLLANAVLAHCDEEDGARDGMIGNPAACHFDPAVLSCRPGQTAGCLTKAKLDAIRKVFAGPTDSAGHRLYSNWPYDTGVAEPGWRLWMLGSERMPALNLLIAPAAINGVALGLHGPPIDLLSFDFNRDPDRINRVAAALDAVSTDYSGMRRRHGKLLIYAGVSDPVFSANDLIDYYRRVIAANGGVTAAQRFARLFLVPGMNHCGGGRALDQFDALTAIQAWVEKGRAPARIIARGDAFPGRSRPLCPYPSAAHYKGSGNIDSAASFECR